MVASLEPMLLALDALNEQIKVCDVRIRELCRDVYPETALLEQVPGVGPITALSFVLTVDRPERFTRSRDVGAYFGLVPRQRQSGAMDARLSISKAGDRMVRCLLVQCAHYIMGPFAPDSALRRWGMRRLEGGMTKRKVIVALARKLAVLLHRLWVSGEAYEPLHGVEAA